MIGASIAILVARRATLAPEEHIPLVVIDTDEEPDKEPEDRKQPPEVFRPPLRP